MATRKYLLPVFASIVGPFTLGTNGNWNGPGGGLGICDEVANYFDIPAGITSFKVQATATKPTDRPFTTIHLRQGPAVQNCLSYNCPERAPDKWFKVQEPLRALSQRLWDDRPANATTLTIFVSLFTEID